MADDVKFDPLVAEVFMRHLAYLRETTRSYLMAKIAFTLADFTDVGVKKVAKSAKHLKGDGVGFLPDLLEDDTAIELVKYAEEESKRGYPILTAQVAVALWGGLEALVEDLLVALITSRSEVYSLEPLGNVKVKLAIFELMDKEDRARYLLRELDTKSAGSRNGVNAFEPLLDHFGLSGAVKEKTKEALFELSQVRNIIVHRLHLVDSRFHKECSRLGYKKGDRLIVNREQVNRYVDSIYDYTKTLSDRMGAKWPKKQAPEIESSK